MGAAFRRDFALLLAVWTAVLRRALARLAAKRPLGTHGGYRSPLFHLARASPCGAGQRLAASDRRRSRAATDLRRRASVVANRRSIRSTTASFRVGTSAWRRNRAGPS